MACSTGQHNRVQSAGQDRLSCWWRVRTFPYHRYVSDLTSLQHRWPRHSNSTSPGLRQPRPLRLLQQNRQRLRKNSLKSNPHSNRIPLQPAKIQIHHRRHRRRRRRRRPRPRRHHRDSLLLAAPPPHPPPARPAHPRRTIPKRSNRSQRSRRSLQDERRPLDGLAYGRSARLLPAGLEQRARRLPWRVTAAAPGRVQSLASAAVLSPSAGPELVAGA